VLPGTLVVYQAPSCGTPQVLVLASLGASLVLFLYGTELALCAALQGPSSVGGFPAQKLTGVSTVFCGWFCRLLRNRVSAQLARERKRNYIQVRSAWFFFICALRKCSVLLSTRLLL